MAGSPISPFERRDVEFGKLLFDLENPRIFIAQPESQNDALRELLRWHGEHIYNLAKHMCMFQLFDELLVTDALAEKGLFVVKEGNRRLAAMKCLYDPDCIKNNTYRRKFQELRKKCNLIITPETFIPCKYSNNYDLINKYLEVRHGGAGEGVGTIAWKAINKAAHKYRQGIQDNDTRAFAALQYAEKDGCFDFSPADTKWLSTLARFLTKGRMDKLGVEDPFTTPPKIRKGVSEDIVRKRICLVVSTIASGEKDSRSLHKKEMMDKWLEEILLMFPSTDQAVSSVTSTPSRIKNNTTATIDKDKEKGTKTDQSPDNTNNKRTQDPYKRKYIFKPKERFGVDFPKANVEAKIIQLYKEMETLDAEKFPLLLGIGLRVFLELATAHCERKLGLQPGKKDGLRDRILKCALHMWNNDDKDERYKALKNVVDNEGLGTLKSLQQIVHNPFFPTNRKELFTLWEKFRPYVFSCFQ